MCVRCGTGRIAWCESPDRHASERPAGFSEYWQQVARELVLQARVPGFYSDEDLPTWIGRAIVTLEEAVRVSEAIHA